MPTLARQAADRRKRQTFESAFLVSARAALITLASLTFPYRRCWDDPVWFSRTVLGVDPWHKQVEILEAVRDHKRVAVKSGHKVSKSHSAAILALAFYCAFEDAQVIMTSTTARQVNAILWRELRMMRARSGKCVSCKLADGERGRPGPTPCPHSGIIEGELAERAQSGLKQDFRKIEGFTARQKEAVAGISGRNLLYIVDEASGVSEEVFEAIEGNRAGGAYIVLFSNPTQTTGEFFEAFHKKQGLYHTITVSSEETPNVVEGYAKIPGLATREWVEEKKEEWGEDSPLYLVRVKGEFALNEDGKAFSIAMITEAEERWRAAFDPESEEAVDFDALPDRLVIGLDPAGPTGKGDEIVFCVRRGIYVLRFYAFRGLDEEGHLAQFLGIISEHARPGERPLVVYDRDGVGSGLASVFRAYLAQNPGRFQVHSVRPSDKASFEPLKWDRQRDALVMRLRAWVKDGGCFPPDVKLAPELHFYELDQKVTGRSKVTPKDDFRKAPPNGLGRSPDRADALALSVFVPDRLLDEAPPPPPKKPPRGRRPPLDPYAGRDDWR